MTITRSLRPLAAAALAAGLVLPAAASAAGHTGGGKHAGEHDGVRHASSYSGHQRHKVDGVVQTVSGTTVPATLTVQAGSTTVTVAVAATTKYERRYNGPSSLDEFTAGDRITAWGSFDKGSTTTFDAQRIKDWSIQRAYTRVVGSVAAVQKNGLVTLRVARGRNVHSPYWHGEDVSVTLSPSTRVMSGSATATVDAVQPGVRVLIMGVYDRVSRSLRADRVRILGGHRRHDPRAAATPEAEATTTPTSYAATPEPAATSTPTP